MSIINTEDIVLFNKNNRDNWVAKIAKQIKPGSTVLDVGAGECQYKELFRNSKYLSQDFCRYKGTKKGILKENWDYPEIDIVGDITEIEVKDSSIDAVLCTEVLEHVPEPIKALKEFSRILKKGGKLFISAPLGSGIHQQPYHYYGGFTPFFYKKYLPEYGFRIWKISPNGGFFRNLLQECDRAFRLIEERNLYTKWQPQKWFISLFKNRIIRELMHLDDAIPINEFSVEFFVEAIKK